MSRAPRSTSTLAPLPTGPSSSLVPPLRVAVFSRHQLTRAGLDRMLAHDAARATVVSGLVEADRLERLDVVVFDLAGQRGPVPDDLAQLLAERVPVVALTSYEGSHLAETALALGVADIVHLDIEADELLRTLERAAVGETTTLVDYRRRHGGAARDGLRLTDREISILGLVGTGLPNQEIADGLYLSVNTVKTYIRSAYRKIGVTRRAEAVLWAVHHGLTPRQPL